MVYDILNFEDLAILDWRLRWLQVMKYMVFIGALLLIADIMFDLCKPILLISLGLMTGAYGILVYVQVYEWWYPERVRMDEFARNLHIIRNLARVWRQR